MARITPWYKLVTPREDLREGRPLDASEFAVHLDQVRDGSAPKVYQDPAEFFERTYLTKNLKQLSAEVVRRLNGIQVETSAVFNMATQFGGGKTHSLTLLYHLARGGKTSKKWKGVSSILQAAGVTAMPEASTAVFVGTEFDSLVGRGGDDGTPLRKTPWGEIAWQLMGAEGLALVAQHEEQGVAPGGDVIARLLPKDRPSLILLDELMNYVSRSRKNGLSGQLYTFLHNLSETARTRSNVVLAVSIPASELEMNAEDQADYERLKKLLNRLGRAVMMSAEGETAEIIRRRLFEWYGVPDDAKKMLDAYADWVVTHRHQLPSWFPADNAKEALRACYPFHPSVLSVFERKWQALPRFQRTRGVLRLLALWVSNAYVQGFQGAHKDPLITLGTAPVDDPHFRAAIFEQVGETRLEAAVTTDIAGKEHAHALRLDNEARVEIKKARLHRKIATTIFFESNGGQQKGTATLPEVRLAVAEPSLDIGNVEQCLESLSDACYYLVAERNRFRFSFQPNLNKLLADRRASVSADQTRDLVRAQIQKVFNDRRQIEAPVFFPLKSGQVPDRAALTLVVLAPDIEAGDPSTLKEIGEMTREHGASSRTYKSALIWSVAEDPAGLTDEARKVLAWEDIKADASTLRLDDVQGRQLEENLIRARRDLRESVWRTYKNIFILEEPGEEALEKPGSTLKIRRIDMGLVHSSAAESLTGLVLTRLKDEDLVAPDGVSPRFLIRNWAPAFKEWSTKGVRDAFYASPKFPRPLNQDAVKRTIVRGVEGGLFAYCSKATGGGYDPFVFREGLPEVEFSDDVFLLKKEDAAAYLKAKAEGASGAETTTTTGGGADAPTTFPPSGSGGTSTGDSSTGTTEDEDGDSPTPGLPAGFTWSGDVPPTKWMNFYTRVLAKFARSQGLALTLTVDFSPEEGVEPQALEGVRVALRELGLSETLDVRSE